MFWEKFDLATISAISAMLVTWAGMFMFYSSKRKKANAEANRSAAEVEGVNLDHMKELTDLQGDLLIKAHERSSELQNQLSELNARYLDLMLERDDLKFQIEKMKKEIDTLKNGSKYAKQVSLKRDEAKGS